MVAACNKRITAVRAKVLRHVKKFVQYSDDFIKVICLVLRRRIHKRVEVDEFANAWYRIKSDIEVWPVVYFKNLGLNGWF